jgi:hypothetical protein
MRLLKEMLISTGLIVLMGCGHKKGASPGAEAAIEVDDFIGMFRPLSLPQSFSDSSLSRKSKDSVLHWSVLHQFVADTLIEKHFGKTTRPKLYASGKLAIKNAETYLFVKAIGTEKKAIYILCFDKGKKFTTGMPIVLKDENSEVSYVSSIDSKYALSVSRQRKDGDGKLLFRRNVYVYNDEGLFTLILNESNEEKPKSTEIYNPIDTLTHKRKFTGDYTQDKRNFISFRDGKNNSVVRFFVHFEKDNGKCKGELRGDAKFISPNIARYTANGDPCSLQFDFTDKNVRMKELEGCGNHRDIRCYFEGVYARKKEVKGKTVRTKQHQNVK